MHKTKTHTEGNDVGNGALDDQELDRVVGGTVSRIDSTPLRISNNVTIARQTPKMDFGDRMKEGLDAVGGAVANGADVVGGMVPGGAIISAAVSSVGQLHNTGTSGTAAA